MVRVDQIIKSTVQYLFMLILIFLMLWGIRRIVGDLGFWIELLAVLTIAFLYKPLIRRLGFISKS
jgi:hypothetical protein